MGSARSARFFTDFTQVMLRCGIARARHRAGLSLRPDRAFRIARGFA